jgi:hypothetical protein
MPRDEAIETAKSALRLLLLQTVPAFDSEHALPLESPLAKCVLTLHDVMGTFQFLHTLMEGVRAPVGRAQSDQSTPWDSGDWQATEVRNDSKYASCAQLPLKSYSNL